MRFLDVNEEPPVWLIELNLFLLWTVFALLLLLLVGGGLYFTLVMAAGNIFPFLGIIIFVPIIYAFILKPQIYALRKLKEEIEHEIGKEV